MPSDGIRSEEKFPWGEWLKIIQRVVAAVALRWAIKDSAELEGRVCITFCRKVRDQSFTYASDGALGAYVERLATGHAKHMTRKNKKTVRYWEPADFQHIACAADVLDADRERLDPTDQLERVRKLLQLQCRDAFDARIVNGRVRANPKSFKVIIEEFKAVLKSQNVTPAAEDGINPGAAATRWCRLLARVRENIKAGGPA